MNFNLISYNYFWFRERKKTPAISTSKVKTAVKYLKSFRLLESGFFVKDVIRYNRLHWRKITTCLISNRIMAILIVLTFEWLRSCYSHHRRKIFFYEYIQTVPCFIRLTTTRSIINHLQLQVDIKMRI